MFDGGVGAVPIETGVGEVGRDELEGAEGAAEFAAVRGGEFVEAEPGEGFGGGFGAAHGMDFDDGEIEAADEVDGFVKAVALDGRIGAEEPGAGRGGEEG